MDKQERIVCAAIEVVSIDEEGNFASYDFIGVNYTTIREHALYESHVIREDVQEERLGFITDRNRFVDPIEAQQIAIAVGQYKCPNKKIASLEMTIEHRWFEIDRASSNMVYKTLRNYNRQDIEEVARLKAGYLGYELRVEDLY